MKNFPQIGKFHMISGMTGFGRGEAAERGMTAIAEVRSVNNRYLEVTPRLPRTMAFRENEVKELVRSRFMRGKINISVSLTRENTSEAPMKINPSTMKAYYKLLMGMQKTLKIPGNITLEHLLHFPDIIEIDEFAKGDEDEWNLVKRALSLALEGASQMRLHEGREMMKDLIHRVHLVDSLLDDIERIAPQRLPEARSQLEERVRHLLSDPSIMDQKRLELEFALLVDKIDVTEECVRFRSHNKFFIETLDKGDAVGRKLNFLVQEMNREANTIGSKASSSEIAHLTVAIKEELEKIREQLQNIE